MNQAKGKYKVYYKNPRDINDRMNGSYNGKLNVFEGEIENYVTGANGLCAFRNKEDWVLLVSFSDIVQMTPIIEEEFIYALSI